MRVRLEVDPNGGLSVQSEPLDEQTEPVRLKLSEHRVDSNDPRWFHKLADRSHYPDTEEGTEAVLMNLDGLVTETNISNLMVKIAGSWFTPPIEDGCLPGVLRRSVVGSGRVHERSITVDDLAAATDIAVTNAVRGWRKALLTR